MPESLGGWNKDNIIPAAVSELLFSLTEGTGLMVHSIFASGFNLKFGNLLCFAGNKNAEQLPYGILFTPQQTEYLRSCVSAGQTVFCYERGRLVLPECGISILVREAAVFGSSIDDWTGTLSANGSAAFLLNFLQKDMLFCRLAEELPEPAVCLQRNPDTPGYVEVVHKLFGRGPGLTPAGDDLLLGMLFADSLFPFLPAAFGKELVVLTERRYTTDISISNYLCALEGYYCGSFLSFADSVKKHDEKGLYDSIRKILGFGSTSGYHMLLGLYLGLYLSVLLEDIFI